MNMSGASSSRRLLLFGLRNGYVVELWSVTLTPLLRVRNTRGSRLSWIVSVFGGHIAAGDMVIAAGDMVVAAGNMAFV